MRAHLPFTFLAWPNRQRHDGISATGCSFFLCPHHRSAVPWQLGGLTSGPRLFFRMLQPASSPIPSVTATALPSIHKIHRSLSGPLTPPKREHHWRLLAGMIKSGRRGPRYSTKTTTMTLSTLSTSVTTEPDCTTSKRAMSSRTDEGPQAPTRIQESPSLYWGSKRVIGYSTMTDRRRSSHCNSSQRTAGLMEVRYRATQIGQVWRSIRNFRVFVTSQS